MLSIYGCILHWEYCQFKVFIHHSELQNPWMPQVPGSISSIYIVYCPLPACILVNLGSTESFITWFSPHNDLQVLFWSGHFIYSHWCPFGGSVLFHVIGYLWTILHCNILYRGYQIDWMGFDIQQLHSVVHSKVLGSYRLQNGFVWKRDHILLIFLCIVLFFDLFLVCKRVFTLML